MRAFLRYTITWERITDSLSVQVTNDSESRGYNLSPNSVNLSLPASNYVDQRVYRCKLDLIRCNLTSGVERCVVPTIFGPEMRLLLGKDIIKIKHIIKPKVTYVCIVANIIFVCIIIIFSICYYLL